MSVTLTNTPPPPSPLSPEEITRWLEFACELLIKRRNEVIAALAASARAHPTIDNDDTLGEIAENIRIARALTKTGEDRRKENKAPFLNGGRAVDGWFNAWAAPLDKAIDPIQRAMNAYGDLKLTQAKAKALADQAFAKAEAERAQLAASEALRNAEPHVASDALDRVAESALAAEEADARANARPAELTRTYGTYGAVASVRQKWKWRCTDINKVPRAYLSINEDMIVAAGKPRDAQGKPTAVIGGIEWYPETKMGVR